ncbi:MAG: FAD-dependent oxidoreductase [Caldilineaceae bacterium]|nr:FAD-dependent oxidoreductase [Caldilineaceae bacterium]
MNKSNRTNVIVLGGGYAGTLAALRLAGKTKGCSVTVTLVNGHDHFVERIRHHQLATGQTRPPFPFSRLLAGSGVRFRQGWCTEIRPATKALVLQTPTGSETLAYDYLIYALGSTVDKNEMAGIEVAADTPIYTLGDEADVQKLAAQLPALATNRGRLLIVGGGLTGMEAAAEVAEQYPQLQVTLVTNGKLGATLSPAGAAHLHRVFARLGINVVEDMMIKRLTRQAAHSHDGRTLPFDGSLWAGSFVVSQVAAAAGLLVDTKGRVWVDESLRVVDNPTIYVAGDAAATGLRMACATAMPMGAYVADHLAAQLLGEPCPAPFRFSYLLQCISLGRHNGLVQLVHEDDRPKSRILTGWLAARIKELICRFTVWSLLWEKRWPGLYTWLQSSLPVSSLPVSSLPRTSHVSAAKEGAHYGRTTATL